MNNSYFSQFADCGRHVGSTRTHNNDEVIYSWQCVRRRDARVSCKISSVYATWGWSSHISLSCWMSSMIDMFGLYYFLFVCHILELITASVKLQHNSYLCKWMKIRTHTQTKFYFRFICIQKVNGPPISPCMNRYFIIFRRLTGVKTLKVPTLLLPRF